MKEDVDMTDIALDETSTLDALTAGITNDIVDWNSMDQWLDL